MFRRALVVFTAAVVVGSASADVSACGDKFLRAGRSARAKGYAAVHPAAILIYKPAATAKGLKEFESLLKKAGHKSVTLQDGAGLSQALSSAKYDVVITGYADATIINEEVRAAAGKPGLLPILHRPTKAEEAEVAKHYRCVIKPEKMTKYEALEQIDHVMELRLTGTTASAAK
jgi:hypothetical protein